MMPQHAIDLAPVAFAAFDMAAEPGTPAPSSWS
jgi:hypothetical protein